MERGVFLLKLDLKTAVAAILVKNRFSLVAVHFYENDREGAIDLAENLGIKYLYLVPFVPFEDPVINQLAMFKVAEMIADKELSKVIITGENVPLISSDSLEITKIFNENVNKKILRPVFSLTEDEIIRIAKENELSGMEYQASLNILKPQALDFKNKLLQLRPQLSRKVQEAEYLDLSQNEYE